jgi:exosortase
VRVESRRSVGRLTAAAAGDRQSPRRFIPGLAEFVAFGAVATVLIVVYAPIAIRLVITSSALAYQPFAWMVAPFAAYVFWTTRDEVRRRAGAPAVAGALVASAGVAIAARVGSRGDLSVGVVAFVVTVAGLIAALWGWSALRASAFPLTFLLVMAPLPHPVVPPLSLALQRLAAATSETVLSLGHVPVVRQDVFLHYDGITLEIAEPCNGLRFLLTMIAVALAVAWALSTRGRRAVVVVGLGALAGIAANLVRVSVTAVMVHVFGLWAAVTPLHALSGKLVYALTLTVFVAAACRVAGLPWTTMGTVCRATLAPLPWARR